MERETAIKRLNFGDGKEMKDKISREGLTGVNDELHRFFKEEKKIEIASGNRR